MPLILGANSVTGGYEVDNSLRFNSGSSDYLNRTPSSTTNRQTWTWSAWVKRANLSSAIQELFASGLVSGTYNFTRIFFDASDRLIFQHYPDTNSGYLTTTQVFRDTSAWYHIVVVFNSTSGTSSDRMKIYVNGSQVTDFTTGVYVTTYPSQNTNSFVNDSTYGHTLGRSVSGYATYYYNGYMSEVNFIDGQALAPSDFGIFDEDSGIWKPIAYTGTYGTNGFFLEFQDSGALGTDSSGEGNDFTVNNLTSIDQTTDTPTNNFCTLNPLSSTTFPTFSEGNTKTVISTSNDDGAISRGNIFVSKGKWYWEVKLIGYSLLSRVEIGVETADSVANNMGVAGLFGTGKSRGRRGDALTIRDGNINSSYSSNLATNDIVGVALDVDSGTLIFYTNGVSQGTAFSDLTNDTWGIALGQANSTYEINTGNAPFTITTGNSDANGYGNFEHEVPSGYYALNTKNLAEYG
jgi:hypothetical protein